MEAALRDVMLTRRRGSKHGDTAHARQRATVKWLGSLHQGVNCPLRQNESPAAPQCKEQAGVWCTEGWRQQGEVQGWSRVGVWDDADGGAAAVCGGQQQWHTRW